MAYNDGVNVNQGMLTNWTQLQEEGEPRLQLTISFCAVRRSEAGSDSNEAAERGATVTLHRGVRATGWCTVGRAAEKPSSFAWPLIICFGSFVSVEIDL